MAPESFLPALTTSILFATTGTTAPTNTNDLFKRSTRNAFISPIPLRPYSPNEKFCQYNEALATNVTAAIKLSDMMRTPQEGDKVTSVEAAGQCVPMKTYDYDNETVRVSVCAEKSVTDKSKLQHEFKNSDVAPMIINLAQVVCDQYKTGKVGGKLPFDDDYDGGEYKNFFIYLDNATAGRPGNSHHTAEENEQMFAHDLGGSDDKPQCPRLGGKLFYGWDCAC